MENQSVARNVGRPRTRPANSKGRKWYATDAEYTALQAEAKAVGIPADELVRRRALQMPETIAKSAESTPDHSASNNKPLAQPL